MMKKAVLILLLLVALVYPLPTLIKSSLAIYEGKFEVHGESYEEYSATDGIQIHKKDGTWINCTGKQTIKIWDSKSGGVTVTENDTKKESKFDGDYDSGKSTHRLKFEDGLGSGDMNVSVSGYFSGVMDETTGQFVSFSTEVNGPSVDFLNGYAETGPWSIYYDPSVYSFTGSWNFETGTFDMTLGTRFDTPNLRRADNTPIPMIEHAWGTFRARKPGGIFIVIDKSGLLAPYVGLASTITVITAAMTLAIWRVRCAKRKQ